MDRISEQPPDPTPPPNSPAEPADLEALAGQGAKPARKRRARRAIPPKPRAKRFEHVYQHVVARGAPLKFPAPWQGLPCDPMFFRLPQPDALFRSLQKEFRRCELEASGVIIYGADGAAALNPSLAAPGAIVWAIRDVPRAAPRALIADLRAVRASSWTFPLPFLDFRLRERLKQHANHLAVAFSMLDLAILGSLGIPAISSEGLENLPRERVPTFLRFLNLRDDVPSEDPRADWASPRTLCLMDWSIAKLEPQDSTAADAIWNRWGELQQDLELELDDFQRHRPRTARIDKLWLALRRKRWQDIRDEILDAEDDVVRLCEQLAPPASPVTFAQARRRWIEAGRPTSIDDPAEAWKTLTKACDRELIEPLEALAAESPDALERTSVMLLAHFSRMAYLSLTGLAKRLDRAPAGRDAIPSLPAVELQQCLALCDRTAALLQGIQSCRRRKPRRTFPNALPRIMNAPSPSSASTTTPSAPSDDKGSSAASAAAAPWSSSFGFGLPASDA